MPSYHVEANSDCVPGVLMWSGAYGCPTYEGLILEIDTCIVHHILRVLVCFVRVCANANTLSIEYMMLHTSIGLPADKSTFACMMIIMINKPKSNRWRVSALEAILSMSIC